MQPSEIRPEHIAEAAKCPLGLLQRIAHNTAKFYKPTRMVQVGSKLRPLDVPKHAFKIALRGIHKFLQHEFPAHTAAHGGVHDRSCFTAASRHLSKAYLITRDIKDCYPSVTTDEIKKKLVGLGFRRDVARLLARLMTLRGAIPQGSPLSGDALNLYLYDADSSLKIDFDSRAEITRSADDIVASSNDLTIRTCLEAAIESQIVGHGLAINEDKRLKAGFQDSTGVQLVHGIQVNSALGTKIGLTHATAAIEAGLAYVRAARYAAADNLESLAVLRQKVHGWLHYCRQAKLGPARYVYRLLGTGDRLVCNALRRAEVTRSRKWWVANGRCNRPAKFSARWRKLVEAATH